MSNPDIETIHRSLKRCFATPRFLDLFYEQFLQASPEVARHFAHTDMARQKRMVEASLFTSILAAEGVPYAVASIARLGEMHRDLGVAPALYDLWLDSLVETVAACDGAFSESVEHAWRVVLRGSIARMLATYETQDSQPEK